MQNATGHYTFQSKGDGIRYYATKAEAIRGAINTYWEQDETPTVYSPTGKIVWQEVGAARVYA